LERTAKNTDEGSVERLRILVADGRGEVLDEVARTVAGLGHEVVGEADLGGVAALTASLRPDAAIVIVGESSEHALDLIGRIVTEAACPVIAILDVEDEAFIREAARRGIFAYITMGLEAAALQSSLDVVLSRFAEYHGLEGAFARRAITERAKGILMERHAIDEKQAFTMLRDQARRTNRKITDVAEAVALSVTLLPARPSISPTLHVEDDAVHEANEAPGPSPRAWSEER
jgi:two-component system, response regulator / RNA-binding antiterminator